MRCCGRGLVSAGACLKPGQAFIYVLMEHFPNLLKDNATLEAYQYFNIMQTCYVCDQPKHYWWLFSLSLALCCAAEGGRFRISRFELWCVPSVIISLKQMNRPLFPHFALPFIKTMNKGYSPVVEDMLGMEVQGSIPDIFIERFSCGR